MLGTPRHPVAAVIASVTVAIAGLLAMPGLPRLVPGPVDVQAASVPAAMERTTTTEVELPFGASDVTLKWHGNPDAKVSIQLATEPGAFGEVIPVGVDETGLGGAGRDEDATVPAADAQTNTAVIWAAGARFVRVTSDRPLGKVTVVGFRSDGTPRMVIAHDDATAAVNAAVAAPPIVTRAQWGANESYRFDYAGHETWPPSYFPLQVFIVHHTAGRNGDPDPAATIRAIYYDDAVLRGWGDMGYNFLIDAAGKIYEGRHARNYATGELHDGEDLAGNVARGAHAKGYNSGSLGIVLLGTFDTVQPTAAARTSLEKLLAWEAERHGINPTTASTYTNPDLGNSAVLNHISGHRDVNATDCPGALFYPTFPALRTAVQSRISATLGPADTTPPAVDTFTSLATNPTGSSSIDVGLVFTEPVTGLAPGDFSVGGTSSGWSVTGLKGVGSAYTVTVHSNNPTPGSIDLDLAANAVTDGGSHTGPPSTASATATFADDATAPTVGMTVTPNAPATTKTLLNVAVTFSEPVDGLVASDIKLGGTSNAAGNWVVDPVVGSGANYGFTVEAVSAPDGTLTIAIPAGVAKDPAGNTNTASAVYSVSIDRTAPKTNAPAEVFRSGATMTTSLPVRVTWTATDYASGSGIATYDVARSIDGAAFGTIATGLTGTSLTQSQGSGHSYRYEVRAHDRAGNIGAWTAGSTFKPSLLEQTSTSIVYHGTWSSVTSTSYSGGSSRYASAAGAYASLTTSSRGFAILTSRDTSRGAMQVYVDGVLKATIDLYAPSFQAEYLAYVCSFTSVATHSIKIVVVGTAGRPRVYLDAFLIMR